MTFVATPQPLNVPPRVRLDIDSDDPGAAFTSLSVKRDGALIREQPFVGGPEALAFDYEAPFGVPVTYTVEGEYSTYSSVYSTAWPNLTGWTTGGGTPSVAGGYLKGAGPTAQVFRAATLPTVGRLTLSAPLRFSGGTTLFASLDLGGTGGLKVTKSSGGGGLYFFQFADGATVPIVHTSGALTAVWDADGVTVATPQGTWSSAGTWAPSVGQIVAEVSAFGQVPGFTLESFAAATPFSDSATTQLDVDEAWLIHPSQPSLSLAIDVGPNGNQSSAVTFVEASTNDDQTSRAERTLRRTVGRRKAVIFTHGPRQADEWTLVLGTTTTAAKNAVRAIVDDQTPLLLRAPVTFDWDLPDDWYSVGDVNKRRAFDFSESTLATTTLPLTPVDEPIVRQGATWTWGDVLLTYDTWQDVLDNYDTWLDLLAGPTS